MVAACAQAKFTNTHYIDLFGATQQAAPTSRGGRGGRGGRFLLGLGAPGSGGGFFAPASSDAMFQELDGDGDGVLTAGNLHAWLKEQQQLAKGSHSSFSGSTIAWTHFEVDEVDAFLRGGRPPPEAPDLSDIPGEDEAPSNAARRNNEEYQAAAAAEDE